MIGNSRGAPPGTNVMTLSVYTPHQIDTATLDGHALPVNSDKEAGLRVYSGRLAIPAGTTQVARFSFRGAVDVHARYRLLVVPQAMANPDTVSVTLRSNKDWRAESVSGLSPHGDAFTSGRRVLEKMRRFTLTFASLA